MTTVFSNLHRVEVLASTGLTELTRKAAGLSAYSWSDPLTCPSLGTLESRQNPAGASNYPDRTANEAGATAQTWIWSNKCIWDATANRMYGVFAAANSTDNFWSTLLQVYDRATGTYQSYESPLAPAPSGGLSPANADWPGTVGHLFDNTCIAASRRRLYKMTTPKTPTGVSVGCTIDPSTDVITLASAYTGNDLVRFTMGAVGGIAMRSAVYQQPQIIGLNLDAITMTKSSAQFGAARVEIIDRPQEDGDITAGALDFHPNMGGGGSLILFHKNRYWIYDFASASWSAENVISSMSVTNAFHNVGHYHPNTDLFIFGGGSYDGASPPGTRTSNRQFYTLDRDKVLTQLDQPPNDPATGLPYVISVNNGADEPLTRGTFMYDPGSDESIVFHDSDVILAVDPTQSPGSQWRTVGSLPYEVDWVCAVPASATGQSYGVIMTGHSNVSLPGQSSIRLYRAS